MENFKCFFPSFQGKERIDLCIKRRKDASRLTCFQFFQFEIFVIEKFQNFSFSFPRGKKFEIVSLLKGGTKEAERLKISKAFRVIFDFVSNFSKNIYNSKVNIINYEKFLMRPFF